MSTTSRALRRTAAGIGAIALALAGAATFASAANAQVGPAPDQPGAPTEGSLTINKYSGGHTDNPLPENLLDGVEFTVTEVGTLVGDVCTPLDLTNSADWDGLEDLFDTAPATPTAPFCLTDVDYIDVTDEGQVQFVLDVGIYFVQETSPGENPIVSPVPDFFVSIPTSTGADGAGWEYDVVADPKNQLSEAPSKTIADRPDDLLVGSDVTWNLTVPIPTFNEGEKFTSASVTDVLPAGLDYTSSTVSIGGTELDEGTHYSVDEDGVTWTFMAAGHALLDTNQGGEITIALKTEVTEVTSTGVIANNTYSSEFNEVTVPGETVPYTYWGQLKIQKNDNSTPARALEGAQFQVFEKDVDPATCPATAPASGALATGTSNASGVVQWAGVTPTSPLGLWVANTNNGPASPIPTKVYCVYETVAPAGHVGSTSAYPVTITPGTTSAHTLTVINTKKDGPELPLTGASGTLAMTIGGLAIIVVGAGAILASRRRRDHSA